MFYDGGYMGGMHGGWWIFWLLVIVAALFYVWQRPGRRGDAPAEKLPDKPHEEHRTSIASWPGGFYCPCHGSKFDFAGRVFKNVPAPTNLTVPPYQFASDSTLLIGADAKT